MPRLVTLITAAGFVLVSVPVQAQILYGSIVGVVKDAQGGGVPGATITVVNKDTNLTRDTVTNAEGGYNLTNVLPGPYDVKVTLPRFKRGGILTQARSGWCRMRPIKADQIGNVR